MPSSLSLSSSEKNIEREERSGGSWTTIGSSHPFLVNALLTGQQVLMPFRPFSIRNAIYLLLYIMKILLLRTSANLTPGPASTVGMRGIRHKVPLSHPACQTRVRPGSASALGFSSSWIRLTNRVAKVFQHRITTRKEGDKLNGC